MRRPDRCIPPCIKVASLPAELTANSIEIGFINISVSRCTQCMGASWCLQLKNCIDIKVGTKVLHLGLDSLDSSASKI